MRQNSFSGPGASNRRRSREASACLAEALERRVLMAAGDLDFTFDGDGRQFAAFGGGGGGGDILVAPDGKVIVLRNHVGRSTTGFAVSRLNTNGSPDESFGGGGSAPIPFVVPSEGSEFFGQQATGIAVQADRKLVIAGSGGNETRSAAFIMRLREDGSLDPTFGPGGSDGDGIVTMPGTPAFMGVAVNKLGRIITTRGGSVFAFNSNGTLDATFGVGGADGNGVAAIPAPSGSFSVSRLVLAPGAAGRPAEDIVFAGTIPGSGGSTSVAVVRVNSSGVPVTSFGGGDAVATAPLGPTGLFDSAPRSIAVGPLGEIVLAGRRGGGSLGRFSVARLTPAGALDNTFSGDGVASIGTAGEEFGRGAEDVAVQEDGKIVAAGDALGTYSLVRFNRDGTPDRTFGAGGADGDGVVSTEFQLAFNEFLGATYGVALQLDGKVVAVGSIGDDDGFIPGGHAAVARYFGDPAGPFAADGDDQIAEAVSIAIGAPRAGRTIGYTRDLDFYRFNVGSPNRRIGFDVDLAAGSSLDSYLRVFDVTGRELAANDNAAAPGEAGASGSASYVEFTFPAAGTFYVAVSGNPNRAYDPITGGNRVAGSTGGYSLTMFDRTAVSPASAFPFAPRTSLSLLDKDRDRHVTGE